MVDLYAINTFPHIRAIAATTNNTQIKMPSRARKITVATQSGPCLFSYEGQDNSTPSANHLFVTNHGMVEQTIGRGKDRPQYVYVAMQGGTGTILISFEDE